MNRTVSFRAQDQKTEQWISSLLRTFKVIEHIKDTFFEKWRVNYLFPLTTIKVKPYIRLINSDLAASGAYLDSIFCDLLYGDLSLRHEDKKKIQVDRYTNHGHVFTLFIIARSIILNTAYINAYSNLKNELDEYSGDPFNYIKGRVKLDAKDGDTLIEDFHNAIDIFKLENGDMVSILSNFNNEIKNILKSKNIIQVVNNKKISELQLVKLLQYDLLALSNTPLSENELTVLYEISSKTFHRQEFLLFVFNDWCNNSGISKTNIDFKMINTILKVVKICTLLYGYQIMLFNRLIKGEDTEISTDFADLMALSYE